MTRGSYSRLPPRSAAYSNEVAVTEQTPTTAYRRPAAPDPHATAAHLPDVTQASAAPAAPPPPAGAADRDLQPLLRRRLLIFCVLGTWGYGITVLSRAADWSFHWSDPDRRYLLAVHAAAFLAALPVLAALLAGRRLSVARLRQVELGMLVVACGHAAAKMFIAIPEPYRRPDAQNLWAISDIIQWFAIITFYGGLVPNSFRRAAVIIGAVVAVGTVSILASWGRYGLGTIPAGWYVSMAVYLGATPALTIFTTGRLEAYRQAVAEARELGQYRLGRKLGGGGMGEVYLAEHRLLKRPCAVKLVRPEKAADDTFVKRFEREVQAATRLSDPAAVQVYDYGREADGTFYYVMEYLPGLTLEGVVKRAGPLPPGRVVHVLRQVCGALAEAHALGLVHRDVKPGNIMLCRLGGRPDAAKLLDFGLVAGAGVGGDTRLTQAGGVLGTPAYMSPEQARGGDLGPASDLYSLGAVAYFLLAGRPPFGEDNALGLLHAHLTAPVVPPSAANPQVPADLEGVVLKLLAKEPWDRFASAAELEAALAGCGCAGDWTAEDAAKWWDRAAAENPPATECS
jgi:serine/threonine-protein kinase